MLRFGTQYWRPPTPLRKNWKKDLRLMKRHGFNIMRAWAMWGWHNPREGKYDFADLLDLLDLAEKNGLKVIVLSWLESVPG